jgi:sulfate/thiosulfate transport system substrate-binding protein
VTCSLAIGNQSCQLSQVRSLLPVLCASLLASLGVTPLPAQTDVLLNASYDVARELYRDINIAFGNHWKTKTGRNVDVRQSHAGSSVQARAVIDGLEADVVTLNQVTDLEALAAAKRVAPDWPARFPYGASPYKSITAFIVRKGNPKNIKNWDDLAKLGMQIALANPKTSGNGRYVFLGAYGYALKASGGDENAATEFVKKFYKNVPVLDTGGRGATTTFAARGIGDALLTFESEANLIRTQFGPDKIDVVIPPITMPIDFPVAIVEPVVNQHKNREFAKAYLDFLFSNEAQEIVAKFDYRPNVPEIAEKYRGRYQPTELIDVTQTFGGWTALQSKFFADGAVFDQIYIQ